MDVGFIVDSSGSLRAEYDKEKTFLKEIARAYDIAPTSSRAGVITFSHVAEHNIKLHDHLNNDAFDAAVDTIPFMGSWSRIDLGLRLAQSEMFAPENGGRSGVQKILFVLMDGGQTQTNDSTDPALVADMIRTSGIEVIVIGIGRGPDKAELDRIAGGDDKGYRVDSFDALIRRGFVDKITERTCIPATGFFIY